MARIPKLTKKLELFAFQYNMLKKHGFKLRVYFWEGHIVFSLEKEIQREWRKEVIAYAKIMIPKEYAKKVYLPPELYEAVKRYYKGVRS